MVLCGTASDVDALILDCRGCGVKLSLGLVINHTTRACVVQGVTLTKDNSKGIGTFGDPEDTIG